MRLFRKIQGTKGQIADMLMFILFISFVTYFIVSFTSMQAFFKTQNIVDDIIRTKVELVRTKGTFSEDEYRDMLNKIGKYGNFDVQVSLESQNERGVYVTYFDNDKVFNVPFKVGDFIKVFAESRKRPLFAEMLSRNFLFGIKKNAHSNFKMQTLVSGMICTDGYIKGIEVVNIINKYVTEPVRSGGADVYIPVYVKNFKYEEPKINGIVSDSDDDGFPDCYPPLDPPADPDHPGFEIYSNTNPYVDDITADNWIYPGGRFKMFIDRDNDSYDIKKVFIEEVSNTK